MQTKVLELELTEEIKPLSGLDDFQSLFVLVRYQGHPVGTAMVGGLRGSVVSAGRLREIIAEQVSWKLMPVVLGRQFGGATGQNRPLPSITVVVCTRDRTLQLRSCLQALLALDYPNYDILIIDNAPSNDDTAQLAIDLSARYVRETRPGLDWARNRAISEARSDIIAFTDDDARPDRLWLRAIASAFAEPEVMALTGLVLPVELETIAQNRFEFVYGGMSKGFRRRLVRRRTLTVRDLLWASGFGVGANMAFRRRLFTEVGLFDVALDVGTPSGGGGDVEMFHRLVARGHTLIYEPEALVWHTHRKDSASLRRLVYDNGRSFGSYLLTCAHNRTVSKLSIFKFAVRNWIGGWIVRRLFRPGQFPRHLVALELLGALMSPLMYVKAQLHARKVAAAPSAEPLEKPLDPSDSRQGTEAG